MGIQLSSLIEGKPIAIEQLSGRRVAIDAFNWLYQFLSIIRGADGQPLMDSRGRVTSHLSGLFYRTVNLLEAGVKPIYVFDGRPPLFKRIETERRKAARAEAREKWQAALAAGEIAEARKQAARSATLTDEMLGDARALLAALGVPAVQAPSEGEALCAQMALAGDAWAVASQDFDTLLFGAPRLVRNLSIYGRRKYRKQGWVFVNPELITLDDALKELGISRDQLIILGMLVGTDYNIGGIPGIGPVKGLKLVKEKKTLEAVIAQTGWPFDVPAQDIFGFFKNPPKGEYEIEFHAPDSSAIVKLLCDEHDFSRERVEAALSRIGGSPKQGKKKSNKGGESPSLGAFIGKR
ncbi:MAG: flap endonuclease-1 [Candidatus Aenigmatarchaeota archaeon]